MVGGRDRARHKWKKEGGSEEKWSATETADLCASNSDGERDREKRSNKTIGT